MECYEYDYPVHMDPPTWGTTPTNFIYYFFFWPVHLMATNQTVGTKQFIKGHFFAFILLHVTLTLSSDGPSPPDKGAGL